MSPELEVLDQLLGGAMPLRALRGVFNDDEHFVQAMLAIAGAGEILLTLPDGSVAARWQYKDLITAALAGGGELTVDITETGIRRIA